MPSGLFSAEHSRLRGHRHTQYIEAHWGRLPKKELLVSTPALTRKQDLVAMGDLRAFYLETPDPDAVIQLTPSRPWPLLAFGAKDNRLYVVGGSTAAMARKRLWGPVGEASRIVRVDYETKKGKYRGLIYFYHDHDPPYPKLVILPSGFPAIRGGKYKVAKDGIVG